MILRDIKTDKNYGLSWLVSKFNMGTNLDGFGALMILLTVTITIDPFIMVSAFQAGIGVGISIGVGLMVMTVLSFLLFLKCWSATNSMTYSGVWKDTFGPSFAWVPSFCVILAYFSLTTQCTLEFYPDTVEILTSLSWVDESKIPSKKVIDIIFMAISLVPIMISHKISSMMVLSTIGNVGLLVGVINVIIEFRKKVNLFGIDPENKLKWWTFDIENIVASYSYFNTAYFFHPVVYLVLVEMKSVSESQATSLLSYNTLVTAIVNIGCGIMGYIMLYDSFEVDVKIMMSFPKNLTTTLLGKIGAFLSNLTSTTVFILFVSKELCDLIYVTSSKYDLCRNISGIVVISCAIAFSMITESTMNYVWIIGSLAYFFLVFFLPPLFYLKNYSLSNKLWGYIAVSIMILSIPFFVMEIYYTFIDISQ